MTTFIDEIIADMNWRISELATIKTLPLRYSLSDEHKEFLIKYLVPSIYSIWEGFVKSFLTIYITELNRQNLRRSEISLELLTHEIDTSCQFGNARLNFESKQKLVVQLDSLFQESIILTPTIPTEANVNFKVLCNLLNRFCIKPLSEKVYKAQLDKLLLFRNKIAHGENSIKVDKENIDSFCRLVENLMVDIIINVDESFKNKTYLKSQNV